MKPVVCIGATLIDELFFGKEILIEGTSNPATSETAPGGVVCNVARNLSALGVQVEMVTVVGNDADGDWLIQQLVNSGVGVSHLFKVNDRTGKYVSFLQPNGTLFVAACADISHYLTDELIESKKLLIQTAAAVVADTNLGISGINLLSQYCKKWEVPLFLEPVSVVKARKIVHADLSGVFMITPNEDELYALSNSVQGESGIIHELLQKGVQHIWLRRGKEGSSVFSADNSFHLAATQVDVVDTTGAGDAALSAWIWAWYNNKESVQCLQAGHTLAFETLKIRGSVTSMPASELIKLIKTYY